MTLIRESVLAKRSPDLKAVCNTILSNLLGLVIFSHKCFEMKVRGVYILICHDCIRACV